MSYENEIKDLAGKGEALPGKMDMGVLRYLWQAGPFHLNKEESLPKFLARIPTLKHFSDNELRIFAQFLHRRDFSRGEVIFRQGDAGYGFYFVFKGTVSIIHVTGRENDIREHEIAKLERFQYFGEMGLLEEFNRRNASAVCLESTTLIGIFKPDLEDLLDQYPVVGAKFMREVSLVLAHRVSALMQEISEIKHSLALRG